MLPAGVDLYEAHAIQLDGVANQPLVFAHALSVSEVLNKVSY